MSQQLSPLAIIEINEMLPTRHGLCKDVCKEWRYLWQRYFDGEPSHLPKESFANRDEYALAHGKMTTFEAIRMIFTSGGPVTLYGAMPKWLTPAIVEKFLSIPDVVPSSMRPVHAKVVWDFAVNDIWNEIYYRQFQCANCYRLPDSAKDFRATYHVAHPTRMDWCLTLRFQFWDKGADTVSHYFMNVELFVSQVLCRPEPVLAPRNNRRRLRDNDVRNEVFRWLSRVHVDKCQLAGKEWRGGIDWQWKTLPMHSGSIGIKSDELDLEQEPAGIMTFSVKRRLDESELFEKRIFHLPQDSHRDSCLIRNHLRNFVAYSVTIDTVHEWLPWLRSMFAGLRNCHVGRLRLVDIEHDGHSLLPRETQQFIESARPLTPQCLSMNLEATQLDANLRHCLLRPERLGAIVKVYINPHAPNWQLATALEPEPEGAIHSVEPAWMDDLFLLDHRYVRIECDLSGQTSDFRRSSVPNILLDIAKKFAAAGDASDFASKFDVLICNSRLEIRAPKVHSDVAEIELDNFFVPSPFFRKPQYWDVYYISNSLTKDELTIVLKRPREGDFDIAAFRLQRGRVVFEADANDE